MPTTPRNPFKVPQMAQMFTACVENAADNFSEFYYGDGRTPLGPRYPRTGAGHRVAFWQGYFGTPSLADGTRGMKNSFAYACYRAGRAFRGASK